MILHPDSIYFMLRSLLLQEKYSDLTIRCGGQDFKAHRAIVCPQSSFFDKACDGGFKEASTGIIELPDDDPDVLILFLQFLYTGNYEDGEYPTMDRPALVITMNADDIQLELLQHPGIITGGLSDESPPPRLRSRTQTMVNDGGDRNDNNYEDSLYSSEPEEEYLSGSDVEEDDAECHEYKENCPISLYTSLRVYIMADKFDVPALKLLARQRFYNTAQRAFGTYSDFPAVVDELYETTAPTDHIIREIPCRLIAASYDSNGPIPKAFEPVMRKHGDLAVGVIKYSQLYCSESCIRRLRKTQ